VRLPSLRRERSARCGAGAGRIGTGTQTLTPTPFRGIAESRAGRYSRRRARSTRMCPARECLCVPTWPMAPAGAGHRQRVSSASGAGLSRSDAHERFDPPIGPRSPGARPILRRERSARCGAGGRGESATRASH